MSFDLTSVSVSAAIGFGIKTGNAGGGDRSRTGSDRGDRSRKATKKNRAGLGRGEVKDQVEDFSCKPITRIARQLYK